MVIHSIQSGVARAQSKRASYLRELLECVRASATLGFPTLAWEERFNCACSKSLQRGLLKLTAQFDWRLEAWAIFSNHYHFVAHSPPQSGNLSKMLGQLHARSAAWINRIESCGPKVWHNFWETRLTYQRSYLTRLNYVLQNPVKHHLVAVANEYA